MGVKDEMIQTLLLAFVIILITLIVVIFVIFFIFNKRRLKFILEKKQSQIETEKTIGAARIESQEHMLKNMSWELHDNIGQLISVSKLQLSMMKQPSDPDDQRILSDSISLLGQVLEDIRALSRSLNTDSITFMGLHTAIQIEMDRLNRLKYIKTNFSIAGLPFVISEDHQLILFRIIQEIISNVIKHAKASILQIELIYDHEVLIIICKDDGIGMSLNSNHFGLGLKNILARCKLINAQVEFTSDQSSGVLSIIRYFYNSK
jgi:signal transduction histidine kinase